MEKQKKMLMGFIAVVGMIIINILTVLITLKIIGVL